MTGDAEFADVVRQDGAAAAGGLALSAVFSGLSIYYGSETIVGLILFITFASTYWLAFDWMLDAISGGNTA